MKITKLRLLDSAVLAAYVGIVSVGVLHHEPWADEAQAWLLSRDMPFWKMMFTEMHYEVSPGFWHVILWAAQHIFHAPYVTMNWIGAAIAVAGAAVLIFAAPFPRPIRYLMASSYYVLYQYAVIARPYTMLLLFSGLACVFYRRRAPIALAVCLFLLVGVSAHGAIIAFGMAVAKAWESIAEWERADPGLRRRVPIAASIVVVAFSLLFVIARPASDARGFHTEWAGGGLQKMCAVLGDVVVEPWVIGAALLLVLASFAIWRKKAIAFAIAVGGLLIFQSRIYGAPHHEGTIVVAIIAALWIAWPSSGETMPPWFTPASVLVLCCVFGLQTAWSVSALLHERRSPYSGGADAARYLRAIGADKGPIACGGYRTNSVLPYFEKNICGNRETAFVHMQRTASGDGESLYMLPRPDYIVIGQAIDYDPNVQLMGELGYTLVHVSPGHIYFRDGIWTSETVFIYRSVQ